MSRPSFDSRTPRSKELLAEVKALWGNPRVRWQVLVELYLQIPFAFGLMVGCYLAIMLAQVRGVWIGLLLAGIAVGGLAMGGVFHDSNHGAVFTPIGWNRKFDYLLAWVVSEIMLGMSSSHWRRKHEEHHTDVNILDLDEDIQGEPFLRLHPGTPFHRICRYQHVYAWLLYPMLLIPLHFKGHKIALFGGKFATKPMDRAHGWELAGTVAGPVIFYGWSLVIPIWLFGWMAICGFLAVMGVVGFVYSVVFQMAHAVPNVQFLTVEDLMLEEGEERLERYFHQLITSANFCTRNRPFGWLVGHLTFQIEHHLERRYPHPFYRFMAPTVKEWCRRHGLPYNVHETMWEAVKAHRVHLRDLGRQGRFVEIEMG